MLAECIKLHPDFEGCLEIGEKYKVIDYQSSKDLIRIMDGCDEDCWYSKEYFMVREAG